VYILVGIVGSNWTRGVKVRVVMFVSSSVNRTLPCSCLPSNKSYKPSTNNILLPSEEEARCYRSHWGLGPWSAVWFVVIRPSLPQYLPYILWFNYSPFMFYILTMGSNSPSLGTGMFFESMSHYIGPRQYNEAGKLQCACVTKVRFGSVI
jgi:hypothetical protein